MRQTRNVGVCPDGTRWKASGIVNAMLLGALVLMLACGAETGGQLGAGGAAALEPSGAAANPEAAATRHLEPKAMVPALRAAYVAAVQAGAGPEYRFEPAGKRTPAEAGGARAEVPTQGLRVSLRNGVLKLSSIGEATIEPPWAISLRWTGLGRDALLEEVAAPDATPELDGNRASYHRPDGSEEWYLNGPLGVEQAFLLLERPGGDGELVLEVTVGGNSNPSLEDGEIALRNAESRTAIRYTDLFARDASGTLLPSRLEVEDRAIRLVVDDDGARYPLMIDPLVWIEQDKLVAADGAPFDWFGYSLSLSGDTALVGAWGDDDFGANSGSAYVFVRSAGTWTQEQKLLAADGAAGDLFGASVSLWGDTALVGAWSDDGMGSAYVFVRSAGSWIQEQKLLAADRATADSFGFSVSLSGDSALVGARHDDDLGSNSGSAYVFVRSAGNWTQEQKLLAADGAADDSFGYSVSLSGDSALVGADLDDDLGLASGSAYVFVRSAGSWTQEQKLLAADGTANDGFGYSVSLSGDSALVGAVSDDELAAGSGSAYVFVRSAGSWLQEQKLLAADGWSWDAFGCSVSLSGDRALVGARGNDFMGSAYVFARSVGVWTQEQKILTSDLTGDDRLGASVSLSGDRALLSAYNDDDNGTDSGSVYLFALVGASCTNPTECGSVYCVDGVCCDDACGNGDPNDCFGCSLAVGASADGLCEPLTGTSCDDGLFCTTGDSCQAGTCAGADPCPGPDGDDNCAESCDEVNDNCTGADPDGSPCLDDGLFCSGIETCQAGACTSAGDPCSGPDGDSDCAETCDEASNSCAGADPDGSPCPGDGLYCNGVESCHAGACMSEGDPCPGPDDDVDCAESCDEATDSCGAEDVDGAACNDGVFCNGDDSCSAGTCVTHSGNPCPGPDGDSDCAESCNEASDACTAHDNNGSSCDDGLFCNGEDNCSAGACSGHAGDPCPGPDNDEDCAESCDEADKSCTSPDPNGSSCDDGVFCNGEDNCSAGLCVHHSGDPCEGSDDDDNCAESCDEASESCTSPDPDGSSCDDGVFCNGEDSCVGGVCQNNSGEPCPGPDGDDNCTESCDEQLDSCTAPDPDGAPCAGDGECRLGKCALPAGSPCSDDVTCLIGYCTGGVCCSSNDCGAYRCGSDGVCLHVCTSTADCIEGLSCSAEGKCENSPAPRNAAAYGGGCSCRLDPADRSDDPWRFGMLIAFTLVAVGRRRNVR